MPLGAPNWFSKISCIAVGEPLIKIGTLGSIKRHNHAIFVCKDLDFQSYTNWQD